MAILITRLTNMKINYLFLVVFTFISLNQNILSQEYSNNLDGAINIVFAQIKYEGNITAYKNGNTRVYPPQKIPFEKRSYRGTFRVQISGNDLKIKGPLSIRCYLSNGDVIEKQVNPEINYFYSNEVYEVTFDFSTVETLFGETKVELIKHSSKSNEISILCNTNIYIQ